MDSFLYFSLDVIYALLVRYDMGENFFLPPCNSPITYQTKWVWYNSYLGSFLVTIFRTSNIYILHHTPASYSLITSKSMGPSYYNQGSSDGSRPGSCLQCSVCNSDMTAFLKFMISLLIMFPLTSSPL